MFKCKDIQEIQICAVLVLAQFELHFSSSRNLKEKLAGLLITKKIQAGKFPPVWGVESLYVEMAPHTAILPKFFICCKATLEESPPT